MSRPRRDPDRTSTFGAIMGDVRSAFSEIPEGGALAEVPLEKIRPMSGQPRRYYDPERMAELVASISADGVLQPVLVRPLPPEDPDCYELVAGERRYRASVEAGLSEIPAVIRGIDEDLALSFALLENLQREDLNPVEETEAILRLIGLELRRRGLEADRGQVISLLYRMARSSNKAETPDEEAAHNVMGSPPGQESAAQGSVPQDGSQPETPEGAALEVFGGLKMSLPSYVKNRLPLVNLPEDLLDVLRAGSLAYTKARELARLKDPEVRARLLREAIDEDLPLSALKRRVREELHSDQEAAAAEEPPEACQFRRRAGEVFGRINRGELEGALRDERRRERLDALLTEMERLLAAPAEESSASADDPPS